MDMEPLRKPPSNIIRRRCFRVLDPILGKQEVKIISRWDEQVDLGDRKESKTKGQIRTRKKEVPSADVGRSLK